MLTNLLFHVETRGKDRHRKAPYCCTVAAAGADVERLSCRTVAAAGAGAKVSLAVTSSHCSSMATWHVCVLELDGYSCIYSFPLQLSKESEFSFAIISAELRPRLVLVLCVCALFSLPSSTSSHSVWSATPVSGRLTRVEDPWANRYDHC